MPYRHLPNSHAQRLAAMQAAAEKWLATADPAQRLITPEHFAAIDPAKSTNLHGTFRRDVGEASTALAAQAALTTAHDSAHTGLAQLVSHFIQVFNLAVARGVFPRSDRAFYGLDINHSDVPPMSTHADFQLWAGKLLDGETARLAAQPGATPMAMPAIAEVDTARTAATSLKQTQTDAKDAFDKEQTDVAASQPAIDALILDMWENIEFKLRALDGPSRRRRAREWGVVYLTRPDEPADPPPGGGANPPPAPPPPTP